MGKTDVPVPPQVCDVTGEYLRAAAPGQGTITYECGYDPGLHQAEVRFAQWLHNTLGGPIELLNEVNLQNRKTADYLWNHKLWDLKTATTERAANSAIRHGLQQIRENPGGIFLDYRGADIDLGLLAAVVSKRLQWRKDPSAVDIMVVLKKGIHVWRYYYFGN